MKTLMYSLTLLFIITISACNGIKKSKNNIPLNNERMEFTVTKIQNEMDGQTVYLKDNKGVDYITIISIPNGNYVELEIGNKISLLAEEIMESDPAQIISKEIKVINFVYEKTEEEIYWVNARKTIANGMWGQPLECLQIQKNKNLNKNADWITICDEIEHFTYREGMYYQIKILKKWLKNHENLMDRAPYDLELITVISKEEDSTYINPVKTKISTNKNSFKLGESIKLTFEVKNTGSKNYTFLPWGTPIEKRFTKDCLLIIRNNKETINYSGIMVKRIPPTEKDYITLKTNEISKEKVNLSEAYKLTKKGIYTIQFKGTYQGLPNSNILKIRIE